MNRRDAGQELKNSVCFVNVSGQDSLRAVVASQSQREMLAVAQLIFFVAGAVVKWQPAYLVFVHDLCDPLVTNSSVL